MMMMNHQILGCYIFRPSHCDVKVCLKYRVVCLKDLFVFGAILQTAAQVLKVGVSQSLNRNLFFYVSSLLEAKKVQASIYLHAYDQSHLIIQNNLK